MREDSSTKSWNQLGEEFFDLAQTNDPRMYFIMPYTLQQLGDASGKRILDLGCGEGGYSRELAKRNADVTTVDCSKLFIDYAKKQSQENAINISHHIRNSNDLYGIQDNYFDIVLCSMMLMDCEDLYGTIREAARVLKPSGILFASVLHPCFNWKNIGRQGDGIDRQVVVKNYFYPTEWEQPLSKDMKTSVIWRHRTLEDYVKVFVKCRLTIVDLNEPRPTAEQSEISIGIAWLQKIPLFLFWELKK